MEKQFLTILHQRGYPQATLLAQTDSTNRVVRQLALEGAPQGTAVFARRQTAGYGRMGRSFFSPPDTGLYFSVLLRPQKTDAARITLTAAVAVARAVEKELGLAPRIKWVNDLYVHNKKVCGILAQAAHMGNGPAFCVLGIGLNVFAPPEGFGEFSSVAGALLDQKPDPTVMANLAAGILDEFFALYEGELAPVLQQYEARSYLTGKVVTVVQGDLRRRGKVTGIDHRGALVVEIDQKPCAFLSGEVRLEDYR